MISLNCVGKRIYSYSESIHIFSVIVDNSDLSDNLNCHDDDNKKLIIRRKDFGNWFETEREALNFANIKELERLTIIKSKYLYKLEEIESKIKIINKINKERMSTDPEDFI